MEDKFIGYLNGYISDTMRKNGVIPYSVQCNLDMMDGVDESLFTGDSYHQLSERLKKCGWCVAMKARGKVSISSTADYPTAFIS